MEWLTAGNGAILRIGLYLLIFWPTMGYYVYIESIRRGISHPKIRGVVYGFFGILGVVVFLLQYGTKERT